MKRWAVAVLLPVLMSGGPVPAQELPPAQRVAAVPDEVVARPVTLRRGIGQAHDGVSTTSAQAQAFYDQGLAYLHSHVWIEAARSFNQALRLDPSLAMGHLGMTVAYAELHEPAKARAALDRARALASTASEHDRQHIETRALQMAAEDDPAEPSKLAAYRNALDAALVKHPDDVELWLLRGIAQSPNPADRGQGTVATSIGFFEQALTLAPGSVAAHHYLAHAYENAGDAARALEHGAAYAAAAPAMPHAQHVHGHVLRRVGRIEDALRAFESADRLESAYFQAEQTPPEHEGHYEHNLDLLGATYRYLGRMREAEAALKRAFAVPSSLLVRMLEKREWPAFLVSRGRPAEAEAAARVLIADASSLVRAAGHVAVGQAMLAAGRTQAAANEASAALRELGGAPREATLVAPALEALQGELLLRTGQWEKGRAMLDEVARRVRENREPDNWAQALFMLEAIARAAREVGDWDFAGFAARQMLAHDPSSGSTHYALGLVAEHNGDVRAAQAEFALVRKYWANADPDLPELRAVQRKGR